MVKGKTEIANQQIAERSGGAIECNFLMLTPQQAVDFGTKAYKRFTSLSIVSQSMQVAFFWLEIYLLAYLLNRRKPAAIALSLASHAECRLPARIRKCSWLYVLYRTRGDYVVGSPDVRDCKGQFTCSCIG